MLVEFIGSPKLEDEHECAVRQTTTTCHTGLSHMPHATPDLRRDAHFRKFSPLPSPGRRGLCALRLVATSGLLVFLFVLSRDLPHPKMRRGVCEPAERICSLIASGALPRLVELLKHACANVQTPALRCVGNVATGTGAEVQAVLSCDALAMIRRLIDVGKKEIKKEACWTISNLTAGSAEQIDAVCASGVLPSCCRASSSRRASCSRCSFRLASAWDLRNDVIDARNGGGVSASASASSSSAMLNGLQSKR